MKRKGRPDKNKKLKKSKPPKSIRKAKPSIVIDKTLKALIKAIDGFPTITTLQWMKVV